MRAVAPIRGRHFWTGLIVGMVATALMFLVVELGPNETSSALLLIGAGSLLLVGILLMFPDRTWLVGVGFLVGAAVSLAGAVLIGGLIIAQHTV